ncbi:MAG: hypothetical protein R3E72_08305 [Steroidobacteraceae bacterium]
MMASISKFSVLTLALAASVTMACAGDRPPASKDLRPMQRLPETPPAEPAAPGEAIATERVPKSLRAAVLQHARTGLADKRGSLVIKSARRVTWNDGSMGCPQPGMFYTQALVPGYLLVVSDGDREIAYHTDLKRNYLRCDQPLSPRAMREQAKPPAAPPQPSDPVTHPKTPDT